MLSNIGVAKKEVKEYGKVQCFYTFYYKNITVKYRFFYLKGKGENYFYLHKVPKEEDKIRIYA